MLFILISLQKEVIKIDKKDTETCFCKNKNCYDDYKKETKLLCIDNNNCDQVKDKKDI